MATTFQWRRCNSSGAACADIAGAATATYLVVAADVGNTLRVAATTDSGTFTSAATAVVTASAPSVPSSYTPNKTFAGGSGASIDAFLASLNPGDVAGLTGSCIVNSFKWRTGGTSAAPIVLTSNNWGAPATLAFAGQTQWDIRGTAGWWVFDYLHIDDTQTAQPTTLACGGHDLVFRRLEVTNHNRHIGMDLINDSTYGISRNVLIEQCRIHDIGPVAYDNRSHGIYNQGYDNVAQDNLIYNCSARGIQDRAGTRGRYDYNTVADNAVGFIAGDLSGSHGLRGTKNIFAYHSLAGVRTYNNGSGSDNVLNDNFVFSGPVDSVLQNLTVTNTHTSDPLFTSHSGHVYTLQGGSPAAGYGPRTFPPL